MKKILFIVLVSVLLGGCCTTKESQTFSHKDSTVVPPPMGLDTTLPVIINYVPVSTCDSGSIWYAWNKRYGGFDVQQKDTSGNYWRIQWNAVTRKLNALLQEAPRIIAIDNTTGTTVIETVPFIKILGYVAIGMFIVIGFVFGLKGLKIL